ncbi:MAG: putative rane protein [Herbinix sp.]|jgi:stage III sporulation protein AH|nr:putative rane protein [Herbinix sp.]
MKNIFKKNHVIITALAIMIVIAGYLSFTNRDAATNEDSMLTVNPGSENYDEYTEVDGVNVATNTEVSPTDAATDTTLDDETTVDDETVTDDDDADDTTVDDTDEDATDEDAEATDDDDDGELGDISDADILASSHDVADNGELDLEDGTPGEAVLANASIESGYFISSKITREQSRAQSKADLMAIIESDDASDKLKEKAENQMIQLTENKEKENATEILLGAKGFEDSVVYIVDGSAYVVVNAATLTDQQLAIIENVVTENTKISVADIRINTVVASE